MDEQAEMRRWIVRGVGNGSEMKEWIVTAPSHTEALDAASKDDDCLSVCDCVLYDATWPSTQSHDRGKTMEETVHGFAVTAERNGNLFFRGLHPTEEQANQALRRTIDVAALRVVEADVTYAKNGNVRIWRATPSKTLDGSLNLKNETTSAKNALLKIMDFSRNGALMQMFVIDLCDKFARAAIAGDAIAAPPATMDKGCWEQCAKTLKTELDYHLNPNQGPNKRTTNVGLLRSLMGSKGVMGMTQFLTEACARWADVVRQDTRPAGEEWGLVSKDAWRRCAEELFEKMSPFSAGPAVAQSSDSAVEDVPAPKARGMKR